VTSFVPPALTPKETLPVRSRNSSRSCTFEDPVAALPRPMILPPVVVVVLNQPSIVKVSVPPICTAVEDEPVLVPENRTPVPSPSPPPIPGCPSVTPLCAVRSYGPAASANVLPPVSSSRQKSLGPSASTAPA
jgi:hypothetical protein